MHLNNVISMYFMLWFFNRNECNTKRVIDDNISEKGYICSRLICENASDNVCGIRKESGGVRLKLFENECELLKYGCLVDEEYAYGLTNLQYCVSNNSDIDITNIALHCSDIVCDQENNNTKVCGLRKLENGFKIRYFENECELIKHNCKGPTYFTLTETDICNRAESEGIEYEEENYGDKTKLEESSLENKVNNLIIVDGSILHLDKNPNINKTIGNFFAATHKHRLPIAEVHVELNASTRRMLLKHAGPIKVFKPWVVKPKTVKDDYYHLPTLSSCYHRCPKKCPDTYAPVCGNPGANLAREPSLMFQNHCYMDVAQCKMFWENKSSTSPTSAYIESSFMFCLGDQLNALYRFLPLVKSLQHMGRLKKKGRFNYRLRNMRFFNNYMRMEPRLMGR